MATLFFSMAGQGRGHATRVQALVEELRSDHRIVLFAPGDAYDHLAATYDGTAVRVERIPGLRFAFDLRGRIRGVHTAIETVRYLGGLRRLLARLREEIRRERPALVVTDFEPALPRAARRSGVPYVSVNHQHFLVVNDLSGLPRRLRWHAALMGLAVRSYYRHQVETVVSSFYFPPLKPRYRTVRQVGVLLRREVLEAVPRTGGHVACYLQSFTPESVLEALASLDEDVRVYGLGPRAPQGSVRFLPADTDGFIDDLAGSKALISTAGNQLVGEALYLGKPVLALPGRNNHEQLMNAHFLRESGGGDWIELGAFRAEHARRFLDCRDEFRCRVRREQLNGTPSAVATILAHIGEHEGVPAASSRSDLSKGAT